LTKWAVIEFDPHAPPSFLEVGYRPLELLMPPPPELARQAASHRPQVQPAPASWRRSWFRNWCAPTQPGSDSTIHGQNLRSGAA